MDVSTAILAKSDQLNSSDLIGSPQTVSIVKVNEGNADQPVNITTDAFGPGRVFKPSKTVLRILASAWGKETAAWVGHSMTLYRDPSVRWAGEEVGGIRIQALSHIDKPMVFVLPTSKGKTAKSTVTVLTDVTPTPTAPTISAADINDWLETFAAAPNAAALKAAWEAAGVAGVTKDARIVAAKDARKGELAHE